MIAFLPGPARAALAPFALALVYTLVMLAQPSIAPADWATIAEGHIHRDWLILAVLVFLAVPVALVVQIVRGRTNERPSRFLAGLIAARWREDRLLSFVLPPMLFALLFASFTSFKQWVLPHAGFGMDATFASIDHALFLGTDPWRVTHGLFPGPMASWVFDTAYMLWFAPLMLSVLLSWLAPVALRTRFLIAFTLCWIVIGTLGAYLLPSAGPCYFAVFHGSDRFAPLMEQLQHQQVALQARNGLNILALQGQAELLSAFQTHTLMLAGGIAAMPSLHNAIAILFAVAAFKLGRVPGALMSLFAATIWLGSIHLGWHYAVDGIVAGGLVLPIWRLSGIWTTRLLAAPAAGLDSPRAPVSASIRPG